jgi:predicted NUDIX family phosphoesterase
MSEKVLVFDEKYMEGFVRLNYTGQHCGCDDFAWFDRAMNTAFFVDRTVAESSFQYKQIIPYVVIRHRTGVSDSWYDHYEYFSYTRAGSEKRLDNKVSIGFGGHINTCDISDLGNYDILYRCMSRELEEELGLSVNCFNPEESIAGFIYLNNSSVNMVHFGVIIVIDVRTEVRDGLSIKSEGKEGCWRTDEELRTCDLEDWSKVVLGL